MLSLSFIARVDFFLHSRALPGRRAVSYVFFFFSFFPFASLLSFILFSFIYSFTLFLLLLIRSNYLYRQQATFKACLHNQLHRRHRPERPQRAEFLLRRHGFLLLEIIAGPHTVHTVYRRNNNNNKACPDSAILPTRTSIVFSVSASCRLLMASPRKAIDATHAAPSLFTSYILVQSPRPPFSMPAMHCKAGQPRQHEDGRGAASTRRGLVYHHWCSRWIEPRDSSDACLAGNYDCFILVLSFFQFCQCQLTSQTVPRTRDPTGETDNRQWTADQTTKKTGHELLRVAEDAAPCGVSLAS